MGRRLAVAEARGGIHQRLRIVGRGSLVEVVDHHLFASLTHGVGHGIAQALLVLAANLEFVDHKFHAVVLVAVELHAGGNLGQLAVDAHVEKSFLCQLLEKLLIVAFTVVDQRSEHVDFLPLVALEDERHDFLLGIFHHRLAGEIAAGLAPAGVEQAKEIIDLGGGADGASRIAVYGFLLDGDYGRKAGDAVYVGTFERSEHVAGIGGERLDISPLALGVDGIERQRRLAAAAEARDYGERPVGNAHVNIFEIVDPRSDHLQARLDGFVIFFGV